MIKKRARWLDDPADRRDAHRDRARLLRERARLGPDPRAVPAAHHLERRQLGLAGVDARHPRDGARRGPRRGLVAACSAARSLIGARARRDPRQRRVDPRDGVGRGRRVPPLPAASTTSLVGITVACAVVGCVLWGTLMGSMLPFVLRKLGADPASASAPLVATLVDVSGIIIYFTIAKLDPDRRPAVVRCRDVRRPASITTATRRRSSSGSRSCASRA